MNTRNCQQCGERLLGRSDKKFCDDACRSAFNHRKLISCPYQRKVNLTLRKNRIILERLTHEAKQSIKTSMQSLMHMGFNPSYHTGSSLEGKSKLLYRCYEFSYLYYPDQSVEIFAASESVLL